MMPAGVGEGRPWLGLREGGRGASSKSKKKIMYDKSTWFFHNKGYSRAKIRLCMS